MEIDKIVELWNAMAAKNGLAQVKVLTKERRDRLKKCVEVVPSLSDWVKIVQEVPKSPFRLGENDRNWKANFDYLINTKNNFAKMLEDSTIEDKPQKQNTTPSRFNTDSGYKKTENGVDNKTVSRAIGDILKDIL